MSAPTRPITVVVAGSTAYTRQCAEALSATADFTITRIITPEPKRIGRTQRLTENPLHQWAAANAIPATVISERIGQPQKAALLADERPDLLLVVDFGYFVPKWLLEWPLTAPLNIHPSELPRWRGSSPGQFVLLYGDQHSAVTLMMMSEAFDAGPILCQLPLAVQPTWNAQHYYDSAFSLIIGQLPALLRATVEGATTPTAQPEHSPTPVAVKLSRADGYLAGTLFQRLVDGSQPVDQVQFGDLSPVLLDAFSVSGNIYQTVERAIRALSPWPGIWTIVPTRDGDKRLKILSASLVTHEPTQPRLEPTLVQWEGKQPARWLEAKLLLGATTP